MSPTTPEIRIISALTASMFTLVANIIKSYVDLYITKKDRKKVIRRALMVQLAADIFAYENILEKKLPEYYVLELAKLGASWWDNIDFEVAHYFPTSYADLAIYYRKLKLLEAHIDITEKLHNDSVKNLLGIASSAHEEIKSEIGN